MGVFEDLAKGGVEGLTKGVGQLAIDIRTAITGEAPIDPNKRAEILLKTQALEAAAAQIAADFDKSQMQGAVEIGKIEAANPSKFVSGWRPAVGWVCVSGMFYVFIIKPILPWLVSVLATAIYGKTVTISAMPDVPISELLTLLFGMLGLGTMRMFERIRGVANK